MGSGRTASHLEVRFHGFKMIDFLRVLTRDNCTAPRHLDTDLSAALKACDDTFDWERVPFVLEAWIP